MRTHGGFHMAIENTGLTLRPIKEESLRMLFCDHHYVAMETPVRKRAPGRRSAALLSIFLILVAQRLQMKSEVSKQILMDCFINEKAIWTMSVIYHRCEGDVSAPQQCLQREAESTTKAGTKDDTKPSAQMLLDCLERDSKSLNHTVFVGAACLARDIRPCKTVSRP